MKNFYFLIALIFSVNNLAAQSLLYDFNTSGQLAANFTKGGTTCTNTSQSTTTGISGSGALSLTGGTSCNEIYTSKVSFTMAGVGSKFEFTCFLKSEYNSGYGGVGFTSNQAATHWSYAAPSDGIGLSAHGGGYIFTSGTTTSTGTWQGISDLLNSGSADKWYKLITSIELKAGNNFEIITKVFPSTAAGVTSATPTSTNSATFTNATLASANVLYAYFGFGGQRVTNFDDFSINLSGGASFVQPGNPVVVGTASYISPNISLTGNVSADNGSAITEKGFVWNTTGTPTIADNKILSGTGLGSISGTISNPVSSDTYFIRAFATNANGTSYGSLQTVKSTLSTTGTISTLKSCIGSPSPEASFSLSGYLLTSDVSVAVNSNPVAQYEISLSPSGPYSSSVIVPFGSGLLNNVPIYVRLIASASTGASSGTLTLTSANATSLTLAIDGLVVTSIPVLSSTNVNRCGTGTVILSASATNSGIVSWWSSSSGGSALLTGASYTSPSLTTTTDYYVDATNACGTTNPRTLVTATINTAPTITGGLSTVYRNNTTQKTGSLTPDPTLPWATSNAGIFTVNNTGLVSAIAQGSAVLTYKVNTGCTVTQTITVIPTSWKGTTNSDWNTASNWNGGTVPLTVLNLVIDNAVINDLNLDQDRTLTSINFGSGSKKINLGNYNLSLPSVSAITSSSNLKYVKTNGTGKLSITIANSTAAVIPIGNSTYNPLTITNKSGASDVFSARVVDAVYLNGASGTTVTTPIVNRTWDISKANANAGSGVDFVFNWNANEVVNGSLVSPKMNHFTGSVWEVPTVTSTTFGSNMLTVVGYLGTFSPFAISEGTSALPVELTAFNANCTENATTINWQTASEHNSASFDVEKSRDGDNWNIIETVQAAGNSTSILDYSVTDAEQVSGVVYYRLNQIDQNGASKIYGPISANCGEAVDFTAIVFPNPASGMVTIEMNTPIAQTVSIQICGTDGKAIMQRNNTLELGTTQIPLSIESLKAGVYTVKVSGENTMKTIKLIVQ